MRIHATRGPIAPAFALLFAFAATASISACGGEDDHHHGHHHHHGEAHTGTEAEGDDGQVHIAYRIEPDPPTVGTHTIYVTVTTPDGEPLTDARVSVDPDMPGHGHGVPGDPKTTELDDGEYRIDDVELHMLGVWHLLFHVMKGDDIHDHATFEITVE